MRLSHYFLLLSGLLIFSCTPTPQEKTVNTKFQLATPEEYGIVIDSLVKIDSMVMEFVEAKKFPGAVTLVAKNGKIIYESEVGWVDFERTAPYNKDHLFRMASMTKPLVSVAAMQLIEAGKLSLDDPVGKYINAFNTTEVLKDFNTSDSTWTTTPSQSPTTVRHLLTHTSGIPYSWSAPYYSAIMAKHYWIPAIPPYEAQPTLADAMDRLGRLPLAFESGSQWMYGLSTDALGRVVEVASGMDLDDYIRDYITSPLGIEFLDFYFPDSLASSLVKVYVPDSTGTMIEWKEPATGHNPNFPIQENQIYFAGGSGMTGTARDYFLFCQAMLNDGVLGDTRILKSETAQSMHQDQIETISYPWGPSRFGFGFAIYDGHPLKPDGTYYWNGAFGTTFWIDPSNDLIVIQLRQILGFQPYIDEINARLEEIIYQSVIKK